MKHIITPTATSNAEKKQYLNANGWSERLVADNWINNADAEAGRVNIEWGGLRLDEAYNRCRWQIFSFYFYMRNTRIYNLPRFRYIRLYLYATFEDYGRTELGGKFFQLRRYSKF